jgi:sugar/nucleoside kinase (ribokinase family)
MPPIFTAIGNACTDLIAKVDEDFLQRNNITKSFCGHIRTSDELSKLMSSIGTYESFCGGAGANVAHVISALGGNAYFISKIGDDTEGHYFKKNLEENGVPCHFPAPCPSPLGSTIVITLVTPDSERSFISYDVAARTMNYDDYDSALLNSTDYLYLDGYCFCSPQTGESFLKAAKEMRQAGKHVTFNIGDISYYRSNKSEIDILLQHCDSIMCNEAEAETIFGNHSSIDLLATTLSERFHFGAITLGENGAIVFQNKKIAKIPAIPIPKIEDTNGAGDHFSGGFIFGLMNGYTLEQSGKLGALCSADCLSHPGARPLGKYGSLKYLADIAKI